MMLFSRSRVPACVLMTGLLLSACEGDSRPFEESVEIADLRLSNIEVTPPVNTLDDIFINSGETLQLGIEGFSAESGTTVVLTASDRSFRSNNTAVLRVSDNGVVTGIAPGSAEVSVVVGGLPSDNLMITVSDAMLTAIDSIEGSPTLEACLPGEYFAVGSYDDNSVRGLSDVDFSVSEGGEATLDLEAGIVSVNATGGTLLTLNAIGGGLDQSLDIQVIDNLDSIAITPSRPTVEEDETLDLTATGTYLSADMNAGSRIEEITDNVEWSITSNSDVASVGNDDDNKGRLSGDDTGVAVVRASCGTAATTQEEVTVFASDDDDDDDELSFNIGGSDDVLEVTLGTNFQLQVSQGSEYDATDVELDDVTYVGINLSGLDAIDLNQIQTGLVVPLESGASATVTATLVDDDGDEVATGVITVTVSGTGL